jgi:hypothetical protein
MLFEKVKKEHLIKAPKDFKESGLVILIERR